ncbi:hypothetical protein KY285_024588 [Solanum tuberosum]|nr:hypothetical protein KY285_024588 [Solanum tuberosum]
MPLLKLQVLGFQTEILLSGFTRSKNPSNQGRGKRAIYSPAAAYYPVLAGLTGAFSPTAASINVKSDYARS